MRFLLLITTALFIFGGCQSVTTKNTDSGVPDTASAIKEVSPAEAQTAVSKAYSQFIDVRTPEEYSGGHAARAVNIPLDTLPASLDRLEKSEPIYLICQTGRRSKAAAVMLKDAGFNNVLNVTGGTTAWQAANLPMETQSPHSPKTN
jgi:rhodanese-related sulfurtransferase